MKKKIKIGMDVSYHGRNAIIMKIKGYRAKIRPYGESARWVKLEDVEKK